MRHGVQSLWESGHRAECAPGRTQDERGPPKAMAGASFCAPFCTRNRTDPISGFANNGDAMVRKLHKVSDKPASTLGFWSPGVVSKEPHPYPILGSLYPTRPS